MILIPYQPAEYCRPLIAAIFVVCGYQGFGIQALLDLAVTDKDATTPTASLTFPEITGSPESDSRVSRRKCMPAPQVCQFTMLYCSSEPL